MNIYDKNIFEKSGKPECFNVNDLYTEPSKVEESKEQQKFKIDLVIDQSAQLGPVGIKIKANKCVVSIEISIISFD